MAAADTGGVRVIGLCVSFNVLDHRSTVHFAGCPYTGTTQGRIFWLDDIPVHVARAWVLYGELPSDLNARVIAAHGHDSERYRDDVKTCRHCRPL